MKGDLDRTCKKGKLDTVPINQGAIYIILSHAKSRGKRKFVNFESEHFNKNTAELQEIPRMREEALFSCYCPLWKSSGTKVALSSISWDLVFPGNCEGITIVKDSEIYMK